MWNFETIGSVPAKNMASSTYSFTDYDATQAGMYYYRLKIADNDGSLRYSNVISVANELPAGISIWPNPATDRINVSLPQALVSPAIRLINCSTGQTMFSTTGNIDASGRVGVSRLPPGMYLIRIDDAGAVYTGKFLKE